MTALYVLLWLFAVMGVACVVQRVIDAFRHANRVIENAPTPLRTGHVRVMPSQRDRGGDAA